MCDSQHSRATILSPPFKGRQCYRIRKFLFFLAGFRERWFTGLITAHDLTDRGKLILMNDVRPDALCPVVEPLPGTCIIIRCRKIAQCGQFLLMRRIQRSVLGGMCQGRA
ncbi:hypothetical protein G6F35_017540 [Rhizopus arrhizus]|nr:hypothetical protein G6F35_017540 [Rhizopus arrhizus]